MKQLRLIILFSILSLSVTVRAMKEQSVSLDTPTGKINGKIGLPDAEKPPIVLLIAGSGPTDMDGNTNSGGFSMKNNSLKLLAEGLAQRGIATLRFDKRGIASSSAATKKESDLRFEDYVTDVQGWIDRLSEDSRFSDVFVLGHSEGSLIGMLASVDNPKVKGFISLAGAGRPAYDIIEERATVGATGRGPASGKIDQRFAESWKGSIQYSYGIDDFIPSICSTLSYIVVSV